MRTISLPLESHRTMRFAAKDLSRYLTAITGAEYPVVVAPDSLSESACLEIDLALQHDGYHVYLRDGSIHVDGGSPRGCLYGVYAFLHSLGCRWSLPGKEYEYIPRMPTIEWSGELKAEPAVRRRGMVVCIGEPGGHIVDYIDFLAKNGFNYLFAHVGAVPEELRKQMGDAMADRDIGFEYGGHLLPGLLPRDLFTEHPEYFRMENGKRVQELNMCTSNSEGADIMARNAQATLDSLKEFDKLETFHLWADDLGSGGWCSCDRCKDLTATDQTIQGLNQVGTRLDLGDTMLGFCAYHASVYPPKNVKPAPFVRLMFAPRERCYRHALDECEANRRYLGYLKGLIKSTPNEPEVFEYYHDCILLRYMSVPLYKTIGKDVAVYRKAGIDGIASLSFDVYSDWAYGPNTYTLGKALWRGQGSVDDIMEYCIDIYGPAAKTMNEYFDMLSEVTSTAMETCGYTDGIDLRIPPTQEFAKKHLVELEPLVTSEHLDAIESTLRRALNVGKEPYRSRVHDQLIAWEFTRREVRILRDQLAIGSQIVPLLEGKGTESERAEITGMLEQLIADIKAGTEMIQSAPNRLRGWWGSTTKGASIEERSYLYLPTLESWLSQLRKM